jgi:translation initiation factor 1A
MPPNAKGGKNYKKQKHSNENEVVRFIEKEDDQIYARVIKMLGGNNISAYCNDNKLRVCHIRGSMRKRVWLNPGDIILVSLRMSEDEKCDVVMKYDPSLLSKLKKLNNINPRLFSSIESEDAVELNKEDKDLFEIDASGADSDESDSEMSDSKIDAI